jgi:ATP-dependent helicase HrpA
MKALGLGSIEAFPFLDPPPRRSVDEGYRVLDELGALDASRELTDVGRKLARLPVDPRIGRMILGGHEEGALREVLVIAAALGVQDPRERPLAAQQKADQAHRRFKSETSDFDALLRLWRFWEESIRPKGQSAQRRLCRDHFLSYVRMREWSDVHQQLTGIAKELGFEPRAAPATDEAVHRALLPGLLSKVAMWSQEQRAYVGARQTKFVLHPSSGLAKRPPPWIVAAEIVETSQLFGRTAARIDPAWLEEAGKAQLRRSYGETSWAEKQAQVMIRESVTLYGLPIVKDRRVHLGPIDPVAARRLFILHALVRQEWAPSPEPAFLRHNREVFEEVRRMRARARRSDMLADDDAVAQFFEARVPDHVHSGKTFEAWRKAAEAKDPRVLFLSTDDVLQGEAEELSRERFPEALVLGGASFPLTYRFEPGEEDDGVTMEVPLALLGGLDPAVLEWTIPGWLAEQVSLLLHWLPRPLRRDLGGIDELAGALASGLRPFHGAFRAQLAAAVLELTGARVPPSALDVERLPPHLRLRVRVVDGAAEIAAGRDLPALQERLVGRARDAWSARGASSWEREGLTTFGDPLPEHVDVQVGGRTLVAHPGLVDTGAAVARRLFPSRAEADAATRGGLRRLFLLRLGMGQARLEAQVPARVAMSSLSDLGVAAPRTQIVERALDDAFGLADAASFPRDARAFDERFGRGRPKVSDAIADLGKIAAAIVVELDPVRATLAGMAGKPGAPRASLDDVRSQLDHLVASDLFARTPRERLVHLPRYLKGIAVRLERMPNGPQKDLAKAEQVAPLWRAYLRDAPRLRAAGVDPGVLEDVRWLVEELRIAVFAPELKTPVSVSPQRLTALWRDLAEAAG